MSGFLFDNLILFFLVFFLVSFDIKFEWFEMFLSGLLCVEIIIGSFLGFGWVGLFIDDSDIFIRFLLFVNFLYVVIWLNERFVFNCFLMEDLYFEFFIIFDFLKFLF